MSFIMEDSNDTNTKVQVTLPPFSLIRDFWKQNNTRGNVSKISDSHTRYRQIGSSSADLSPLAWRKEGLKVKLVAVIGEYRSALSATRKTSGNFGNVSADALFSKVAYQRKRWQLHSLWQGTLQTENSFSIRILRLKFQRCSEYVKECTLCWNAFRRSIYKEQKLSRLKNYVHSSPESKNSHKNMPASNRQKNIPASETKKTTKVNQQFSWVLKALLIQITVSTKVKKKNSQEKLQGKICFSQSVRFENNCTVLSFIKSFAWFILLACDIYFDHVSHFVPSPLYKLTSLPQ